MRKLHCVFLLLLLCSFQPLQAQDSSGAKMTVPAGFKSAFFAQLDDVEKKIEDLAGAMPAEKYSWRPMEGVRSVSEVYMHIAGGNYYLPTFIGIKSPQQSDRDMEKNVTEKPKVLEELKRSFAYIRKVAEDVPESDLSKPAKFFGQETTVLGVLFNVALHLHEHLGQSIAYARMNEVVPPWTAAAEQDRKKK